MQRRWLLKALRFSMLLDELGAREYRVLRVVSDCDPGIGCPYCRFMSCESLTSPRTVYY
ncbi:hypothetical protein EXIGLDRAFT_297982 [Exidia glandulosa HHB12029]|uniref:Uncharacterized protein n=1 Tax=Exidia glandulosa HHB12029 TaxID=1314781 RepID=A0A165DAU1_EXIGL|nr:hypothetical protein EXIGLDRAFT_297982 [Exidia glandulosa HHB12029]